MSKRYLSDDEVRRFFSVVRKNETARRDDCMYHLALLYGLRVNELVDLKLTDIFLEEVGHETITIRRLKRRENFDQVFELTKESIKKLKTWLRERKKWQGKQSDFLFISQKSKYRSDHISSNRFWKITLKYAETAGIRKVTPHAFRHTTGFRMAREGMNAFAIQRRLGHSSVVSSQEYVDLVGPDRLKEARECNQIIEYI